MRLFEHAGYLAALIRARAAGVPVPLVVSLAVTNRCNYRCVYCYGAYYDRRDRDIPLKTWLALIDELSAMGTRMIHIGGGEPLLRADVGDIIGRVKDRGMILRLNTNGALIPRMIDRLRRVDSICVSLDGGREANDLNRGAGTFDEIIEGIRCAVKSGIPTHVSATVTANSIGAASEVLSIARGMGFMVEFGLPYEQTAPNGGGAAMKLRDEELRKFLRMMLRFRAKGLPVFYSASTYRYALGWPLPYSTKIMRGDGPAGFKKIECHMGRYMCFIDGDGLVYPCGQLIGSFPALSFIEAGFKRAWENLLPNKSCTACYSPCFTEFNQIHSLRLPVIAGNAAREVRGIYNSFVKRLLNAETYMDSIRKIAE